MGIYLLVSSSGRSASMGRHATPRPLSFGQVTSDASAYRSNMCLHLQWVFASFLFAVARSGEKRTCATYKDFAISPCQTAITPRAVMMDMGSEPTATVAGMGQSCCGRFRRAPPSIPCQVLVECRCSREPLAGRRISYRAHVNLACA